MMINLDKFLILELQQRGFDVDYNKMVEIYRASRQQTGYINRKIRKEKEEAYLQKMFEKEFQVSKETAIKSSENGSVKKKKKTEKGLIIDNHES